MMENDDRSTTMWPREVAHLLSHLLSCAGVWIAPPVLRIALAYPFFRSGLTRWDSFLSISQGTIYLFEEQFKLHIFGHQYPFPFADACAYVVGTAEIVFPILLILGLATRFTGTGLLIMTGVIQLTYPEGWANFHLYWAAIALAIMALGPGPLSCDWLIGKLTDAGKVPGRIMPGASDIQSSPAQ